MTTNKFAQVLPLSLIGLASVIAAGRLAIENKAYGGFLLVAFFVAFWTKTLIEKD